MSKYTEDDDYAHYILRYKNMKDCSRDELRKRLISLKEERDKLTLEINQVTGLLCQGNPPLIKVVETPRLITYP